MTRRSAVISAEPAEPRGDAAGAEGNGEYSVPGQESEGNTGMNTVRRIHMI